MSQSKIDLILHPVRLRIIGTLAGRSLTPAQIASLLPDVPQASLYRHINALLEENILTIVSETQVRGTLERTYAITQGATRLTEQEIAALSAEDQLRYIVVFLSSVMQDARDYLQQPSAQPDLVLYSKTPLYVTEEQFRGLLAQVQALLQPYTQADPNQPEQKRFLFTGIVIPDKPDKEIL